MREVWGNRMFRCVYGGGRGGGGRKGRTDLQQLDIGKGRLVDRRQRVQGEDYLGKQNHTNTYTLLLLTRRGVWETMRWPKPTGRSKRSHATRHQRRGLTCRRSAIRSGETRSILFSTTTSAHSILTHANSRAQHSDELFFVLQTDGRFALETCCTGPRPCRGGARTPARREGRPPPAAPTRPSWRRLRRPPRCSPGRGVLRWPGRTRRPRERTRCRLR